MKKLKKYIPAALFILYMAALMVITIIRPWSGAFHFLGGSINLRVLIDYIPILQSSFSRFIYLFFGNIVWFIPLGFYLAFFKQRTMPQVILYGFLLSLFIEVAQFVLGTGFSEIDDLILNTAGCIIGALAGRHGAQS